MIYVTGDVHAGFEKFSHARWRRGKELTRDDYVLVCGDFGIWKDDSEERYGLDRLEEKNFNILFCDGNHENFDRLYSDEFEVVDFCGGKAHKIRENVYHLMRGEVFEICGKKIFVFGGARSHDIQDGILDPADFDTVHDFKQKVRKMQCEGKYFRINHLSWWKEEMPSEDEMRHGWENLSKHDFKVDYIISHDAPSNIVKLISSAYQTDMLNDYLRMVSCYTEFKHWYFGHYHLDNVITPHFTVLFRTFEEVV